jgi:hypothetical protein
MHAQEHENVQAQKALHNRSCKEDVMKTISTIVLSLLVAVSYALASGGTEVEGLGLMGALFIAFGVLIVLHQFVPGLILLGGMLKGIFSSTEKKASKVNSH